MNHTLTVRNAYGRDFKNKSQILKHYHSNYDFQNLDPLVTGAIINKQDATRYKVDYLRVRYNNLRDVQIIDIKKGDFQ